MAAGALAAAASLTALALRPEPALAADLHRYEDADIALGEKLIREHQCEACHARRVGGDGSAKPKEK